MRKILSTISIALAFLTLTACSIAPGMPGLQTEASKYAKAQKEGVDYKVVLINANTIKNQKPFNYAAYINAKKQRARVNTAKRHSGKLVVNSSIGSSISVSASDNKANYQYYIGKGDVLSITVWDHPDLSEPGANGHIVGSDGRFYFPYSGKVNALGKTVRGVRDELESKLGSFITKPQVSVAVTNYRSQKVYTSGALAKPSTLMVKDTPTTVRDAISKSGGLRPNLYTGHATLARNGQNISIDLNRMLRHNDNRQNFILKNGDRLHVLEKSELQVNLNNERSLANLKNELEKESRAEQAKVFVMGEVYKPGSVKYQVEDGMTLAEAINDSGSFKEETFNSKGIFVIRKENFSDKIPTIYQLPVASVQSMFLAEQFNVRPRDIVYVTSTPSIRWNRVISQLLPSLAILNTFRNFQ